MVAKKKNKEMNVWAKIGIVLVLALATYLMGSRALDTGSLIEYGLTIALLVWTINRLVLVFHKSK